MQTLKQQYKSILLVSLFIIGVSTTVSSIVLAGFQNFWVKTCNSYQESGFLCLYNSTLAAQAISVVLGFVLGYLLFLKWLGLMGARRLALIVLTFLALQVLYDVYNYNDMMNANENGSTYLGNDFSFFLNWSSGLVTALIASLWLLVPARKKN